MILSESGERIKIPQSPVDVWISKKLNTNLNELSKKQLEDYQLREMRRLIQRLKHSSSFYREKLWGCDPEDIQTMEDIRNLPTTCEQDLIGQEWRFQCVSSSQVQRIVTVPTTGTSGMQKRICFTHKDLGLAMAFAPFGFAVMCKPGEKVLVMMSGDSEGSIGDNVRKGIEPLGMQVKVYGQVTDLMQAAHFLLEYQPDVIVGIPVHMAALERYMQRQNMMFKVKSVLLSADDVPEAICERLRGSWGCHTFRHYGMTELCMFGAVECLGQDGYHMRACDHFFEILEPDEDGFGEIAVTTFHHEAMPLLRYRTGDIGRMTEEVCRCGSPLSRIKMIKGRLCNSVQFPNGRLFLRDVEEIVFRNRSVIDFECRIESRNLYLLIRILPGDMVDLERISKCLERLSVLEGVEIFLETEILDGFEKTKNTKKRMVLL